AYRSGFGAARPDLRGAASRPAAGTRSGIRTAIRDARPRTRMSAGSRPTAARARGPQRTKGSERKRRSAGVSFRACLPEERHKRLFHLFLIASYITRLYLYHATSAVDQYGRGVARDPIELANPL